LDCVELTINDEGVLLINLDAKDGVINEDLIKTFCRSCHKNAVADGEGKRLKR